MRKSLFIAILLSAWQLCAAHVHEPLKERLYLRLASMWSGEAAVGYEHRFNHWLGLGAGLQGGFHYFNTLGDGIYHVGPELGVFFYTHAVESSHQFYLAPVISTIYGQLTGHSEVISRYSSNPHVLAARLHFLGGYRYSFSIPLSIDVGLGMDALALVVPLNNKPSFLFFWPMPFIQFGVGYRF